MGAGSAKAKGMGASLGSLQKGNPQASPEVDKERIMRARMEEQAMRSRMEQERGRSQAGRASMFPGEAPPPSPARVPGTEEAMYRRGDVTRARDARPGAREEMYNNFARAEAERRAFNQGARSGIMFGPGRANRMPEPGSPEYNQLIQRARQLKR